LQIANVAGGRLGHRSPIPFSSAPKFPDTLEGGILDYAGQMDVIRIHRNRWKKNSMIST
jgi:hypothetical protein